MKRWEVLGGCIMLAKEAAQATIDLLYPAGCPNCGVDVGRVGEFCAKCDQALESLIPPYCEICSLPFEGHFVGPFQCPNCQGRSLHFGAATASMRSKGIVRELIHRFKYRGEMQLLDTFIPWMRTALLDPRLPDFDLPLLVPVPLHPARRRERGFNQAELLARSLGKAENWPVEEVIRRIRYTTTQTALDRSERSRNLDGAFVLRPKADVEGRDIILVDDVLTTCSTVDECARVLLGAGAKSVWAIAVARA
jgi:ComF family protein